MIRPTRGSAAWRRWSGSAAADRNFPDCQKHGCRLIEAIPGDENRSALFFAVGSTLFAWLLLRGRTVPTWLARFGVLASVLLVALLFVQRAGVFAAAFTWQSPSRGSCGSRC